jgi:hybrid cluster-associated redox disulfide protein
MYVMTNNKSQFFEFNGSEFIADLLLAMPEASDILMAHGLGCVECQFSTFETLEEGFLSHGFSRQELEAVLADLNEAAQDLQIPTDVFDRQTESL